MTDGQSKVDQITLLVGFDAMRFFLQSQWEEDAKQSDDLAVLLSNVNRNLSTNSQPLDLAQWSDWLDAVVSVRPDLIDVRKTRQDMQDDHDKFFQILEIQSSEIRKNKLDEFRSVTAVQTWHRIGYRSISILDAYAAMRSFLWAYWNRGGQKSLDIGNIVDALDDTTTHVVLWENWLVAIQKTKTQADRQN